jgi:hypothetical protein
MIEAIERDRRSYRVFDRAIYLQNVPNPQGGSFRWVLAVMVPNEGLFTVIQEDYIYGFTDESFGDMLTIEQAKRVWGSDVVDAAIQRTSEVRGHTKLNLRPTKDGGLVVGPTVER